MNNWVDIRNFDDVMSDYQKSPRDSTIMPGLGTYFKRIIAQNERIIILLDSIDDTLRNQE